MTHERVQNVEGGPDGQDWLDDASTVEPEPLEDVPVGDLDPYDVDTVPDLP